MTSIKTQHLVTSNESINYFYTKSRFTINLKNIPDTKRNTSVVYDEKLY